MKIPKYFYFRVNLIKYGTDIKVEDASDVNVVRCKDCRHRDEYGCCKYWKALSMSIIPIATDDDDFCSYAERKEVTE